MSRAVVLRQLPPSAPTGPPQVSPMPMALQALPPLLMLPTETAPPLAEDVATPPLPAEATSVVLSPPPKKRSRNPCAATSVVPRTPAATPIAAAFIRCAIVLPLYSSVPDIRCASSLVAQLASRLFTGSRTGPSRFGASFTSAVGSQKPSTEPLAQPGSHQYLRMCRAREDFSGCER